MSYDEITKLSEKPHNIILEDRCRMSVSGVSEVERFDEAEAVIQTNRGRLLIRGSGLHAEKLSLEAGELLLEGTVDEVQYEESRKEGGLLARLFR